MTFIRQFLEEKLALPVLMEYPDMPAEEFVIIEKTGGSMENHIWSSTIACQCYAKSLFLAEQLSEKLIRAMFALEEENEIISVTYLGDYPFSDPKRGQPRYQAVFQIRHYKIFKQ